MAITRDKLVAKADEIEEKMIGDHNNAGVARGWNRFIGQIPSKSDVVRAALVDLRLLNDLCLRRGWKPLYEEEEEPKLPKRTK